MIKVSLISLGCAKNLVDSEIMVGHLHQAGMAVIPEAEKADVVIVNTCSFIDSSKEESIGHILEDVSQIAERLFAFMPNTQAFNNTGQPAMTVPLAWSASGLPIGMQFVGRMGEEATLFSLAGQLERARPWFDRVPEL